MQRVSVILLLVISLMWLDLTVSKAVFESQNLHYNPVNGDFQTYNPLRRMAAGEAPGRDFQPYMGLGITYVTYLPFKLMGQTFSASKFSAQLMHMWLFGFGSLLLLLLLRVNWIAALGIAFMLQLYAYIASDYLYVLALDWKIAETGMPLAQTMYALSHAENSCLGIRVALPLLTAALLLFIYRNNPKFTAKQESLLWGFLAGAQAFWSNDFGFTSMAVLSAIFIIFRWKQLSLPMHIIGIALGFFTLFTLATHGYPLRALAYNFGGVAKDQFWYFMLDEEGKVFSLKQYFQARHILYLAGVSAAFCAFLFFYLLKQKKAELKDLLFFYIFATSLAAGLLSTLGGGIMERYLAASLRLLPFAILFFVFKIGGPLSARLNALILLAALGCGIAFYAVFAPPSALNLQQAIHAKTDGHYFYSDWAGGYLSNSQKKEIELAGMMKGKTVFSTYSSLMDAAAGAFQPSHIDYIIHALGQENRKEYLASFARSNPDFVTTPNELWTAWETWSRRANWWFYREVLRRYEPYAQTAYHVVWKKRAAMPDVKARTQNVQCAIQGTNLQITDTLPAGTYYVELTVGQHTGLQNSGVPVIGNRALITVEELSSGLNALQKNIAQVDSRTYNVDYSLNPQILMLEHKAGEPSLLRLRVAPKERATLSLSSCAVSAVYDFPAPPPVAQGSAPY